MNNLEITYYAENGSMGDTDEANCDAFRAWAKKALEAEYPGAYVDVSGNMSSVECFVKGADSRDQEEEIAEFCSNLWNNCPWGF